ncbi:MAG: hypothetical protein ACP5OO_11840 [Chloroflexia bacterium]
MRWAARVRDEGRRDAAPPRPFRSLGLADAPLCFLLLLTLLAGLAAYQVPVAFHLDVGGPHDAPYLGSFYEPEQAAFPDGANYRWTRAQVGMRFPGLGRQPLEMRLRLYAPRPTGLEASPAGLWVGETSLFSTTVSPHWQVYRFLLPPEALPAGDLYLELHTPTFRPPGEGRELGLAVDWVEVRSLRAGRTEPAWGQVGLLMGSIFLAYLLLRRWGLRRRWSALLLFLAGGLLGYLLGWHRLGLTLFTVPLVLLLAAALLLTLLFLPRLERSRFPIRQARLLWAVLLLGFVLRLGGMLYPQFRSSDLLFHVHRAEWTWAGNLLFTADLPDVNLPAPYPPGFYIALAPAALLPADLTLVMEVAGAALDALCGLLLYVLALRLGGRSDGAIFSLLLAEAAPVTFLLFLWGNYTNMFSRVALLGALVLLALGHRPPGRGDGLRLAGVFLLTLLGHFADSLLLGAFVLAAAALGMSTSRGRRLACRALGALALAGATALFLYYSASPVREALVGGLQRVGQGEGRLGAFLNPLPQFFSFVQPPTALLALPGLFLLRRARGWTAAVLGGALLAALLFGLGQAFYGFSTRYSLFILPVLALGSGAVLAGLRGRGAAGRLTVLLLLALLLWNGLWRWGWTIAYGLR